jgi:hypothetical protein
MGSLTDNNFKKDENGRTLFYPWGICGKGLVLPDEEAEKMAKLFLRRYYFVTFSLIIVIAVIGVLGLNLLLLVFVFLVLYSIILVWYYLKQRKLLATYQVGTDKLTLKDNYRRFARNHSKSALWAGLALSLLFFANAISMVIRSATMYKTFIGILSCLVFGICAWLFRHMIKIKDT